MNDQLAGTPGDLAGDLAAAKTALGHEFTRYGRVIHVFRARLSGLLPPGLDPAAAQLLATLVKLGPSRQGELAECTFLDPSTVSRRISQLVHQGLVERRADPVDGRAVQLVPTARGEEFFAAFRAHSEEIMQQVLNGWSHADLTALGGLLRKFNDDFEVHRSATPPSAPIPTTTHFTPASPHPGPALTHPEPAHPQPEPTLTHPEPIHPQPEPITAVPINELR